MHEPGESASWREVFDRHGPGLILYARQWCPSHADAEDAVQEAFVRCWRSRPVASDLHSYLFVCVKNAALDQRRGERRRRRREAEVGSEHPPRDEDPFFTASVEQQERTVMLEQSLASLPREQREVLVMKLWGGLTFGQIAEVLQISSNTAASRYRYALEQMRKMLPLEQVL